MAQQAPFPVPAAGTMIRRGFAKMCPRCGRGHMFRSWFKMKDKCDRCGLPFEREDAHFVGAMAINLVITEFLFGVLLVAWVAGSWPNPPWLAITLSGIGLNAIVPIIFFPYSKAVWTAIDLAMHKFDSIDRATIEL